jgi:hypothetical protein
MTGNAAIYSSRPPPDASFIENYPSATNAGVTLSADGTPARYSLEINGTRVTINVMPQSEIQAHLNGFMGYVSHLHHTAPSEHTQPLIARLEGVRTVLGVIVEPDYDEQEQAAELVWALAGELDALVFAADSVFSCSGEPLVGPAAEAED